jgi:hypothetical protein
LASTRVIDSPFIVWDHSLVSEKQPTKIHNDTAWVWPNQLVIDSSAQANRQV